MKNKKYEKETDSKVSKKQKSKLVAFLLALFLGIWGAHNFYLGFKKKAIIQVILYCLAIGWSFIWAFIEVVMILIGRIDKDAEGNSLKPFNFGSKKTAIE